MTCYSHFCTGNSKVSCSEYQRKFARRIVRPEYHSLSLSSLDKRVVSGTRFGSEIACKVKVSPSQTGWIKVSTCQAGSPGARLSRSSAKSFSRDFEIGVRLAKSLGIDVSDIELPY